MRMRGARSRRIGEGKGGDWFLKQAQEGDGVWKGKFLNSGKMRNLRARKKGNKALQIRLS